PRLPAWRTLRAPNAASLRDPGVDARCRAGARRPPRRHGSEQLALRPGRGRDAEGGRVQRRQSGEPEPPARARETLRQQLRERPLPLHAPPEAAVVVAPAAHLPHQAHHVRGAVGKVQLQPFLPDFAQFVRQPQQHVAGGAGAGLVGGFEDRFELVVGDRRHHRRHQHPHRHAGVGKRADRAQAGVRRAGARLHPRRQAVVERGHRDMRIDQALRGQRREQVEVALHQRALGHQPERVAELGQHLDQFAGDPVAALDRLVGVGVHAQRDRRAAVALAREFGAQAFGGIGLGEQPGLEVQPRRQVHPRVRRARVAVHAAVLAAAVGIDRLVEAEVGRLVAADDAARGLFVDAGVRVRGRGGVVAGVARVPAVVAGLDGGRLVAAGHVRGRAPPLDRGGGRGPGSRRPRHPASLAPGRRSRRADGPAVPILDLLRQGWDALAAVPHLRLYLALGWAVYLLLLGGWIVLQKREPVATLSWLLGLALLPYVGFLVYHVFGPQRIR